MSADARLRSGSSVGQLLRVSPEPDRLRLLIAQAAALGHAEALKWAEDLALDVPAKVDPVEALAPLGDSVLRLWACDCAERVLSIYEREHPGDDRPREAVRVSRAYARGEATAEELRAAVRAARGALAAAWAAQAAAMAAAWAARAAMAALASRTAALAALAALAAAQAAARDARGAGAAAWATERDSQWLLAAAYLWAEVLRG